MSPKKQILVTGGAGFIGSHLVKALTQKNHEVTVLDLKKPEHAISGVHYLQGDVRKDSDLIACVPGKDLIYHFAAQVSVPECQADPLGSYETNTLSTLKILNLNRRQKNPAHFIFSSSSAVYGASGRKGELISETIALPEPLSFYGHQKLSSEQSMRLFHSVYQTQSLAFRFFNVYGPGQKSDSPYSGVISLFNRRLKEGLALSLNGGGHQTRDFISVHDVVGACLCALESVDKASHESIWNGQAFNLGTGHAVTIRELAELMSGVSGKKVELSIAPARSGDIEHSCANSDRAKNYLNWSARVSLSEGLKELWESELK